MSAVGCWRSALLRKAVRIGGASLACALVVMTSPAVATAQCSANEFCVYYDTASSSDTSVSGTQPRSTLSWDHTMATGVHRAIVVGVSIRNTGGSAIPAVTSVTYNGVSLNYLNAASSTETPFAGKRAEIWGRAGDTYVASGTHPVVITLSGDAEIVGGAVTFTGVDPTTAFSHSSAAQTGSTAVSTQSEADTSSVCVDAIAIEGNITASVYSSFTDQISRWNRVTGNGGTNLRGAGSTRPGQGGFPTTTLLAWTLGTSEDWAVASTEVKPFDASAIHLASFGAEPHDGRGVALNWQTGGEQGTLGFRLYRENTDGDLVAVNREMVAGSTLISKSTIEAGYSYAWWDGDGNVGDRYWLEEIEVNGGRRQYGPFTARAASKPSTSRELSPTLSRAAGPAAVTATNPVPAIASASKSGAEQDREEQLALAADPTAIKIGVRERGWYRIDQGDLVAAGLDPEVDPDRLQLFTSGREIPIRVTGAQNGRFDRRGAIEFYGLGVDEVLTDTRVYWLVAGEKAGRRIPFDSSGVVGKDLATIPYTVELRERLVYVASFANGDESNFYGAVLVGEPVDRTLDVQALDADATAPSSLELGLRGFSEGQHAVDVHLNDVFVATLSGVDQEELYEVIDLPPGALREGDNLLRLTGGPDGDICLVDVIRLQYPRRSVAENDELLVSVPDSVDSFVIDGFTRPWVNVLDVSDPFDVSDLTVHSARRGHRQDGEKEAVLESKPIAKDGKPAVKAKFALPLGTQRTIHAIGPDRVLQPAWVQANEASSWNSPDHEADVLVVAPRELVTALRPLVDLRESQGYSVSVISVEDAYDEYGFGIKRVAAIRDLVRDAVTLWRDAPEFLILVGDASYDPRDFLGLGSVDLLPAKFVATDTFEAVSDDWFGDVDGDLVADLVVGRLPVKTVADLQALVRKTIAYELDGFAWSKALYVSDDDMGQQFESSNSLFMRLLPSLDADQVLVRELGSEAARTAVVGALNQGVSLVSYVGHGSVESWSGGILSVEMLDQLSPEVKPAVFTMMNCMNGYFFDAALDSLAEALLATEGGAVAVFAPTGITGHAPQEPMMAALYEMLETDTEGLTFGEAVAVAKQAAGSEDVRRTWVVLGDPMIHVR